MTHDPYEILGVSRDATPAEINAAYRAKARKSHPDSGGSTEEFMRMKGASIVLLNPKMREHFDRTGEIGDSGPDNSQAKVMELVANFFINSIEALDQPMGPRMASVDIIQVGKEHFTNQISEARKHISNLEARAKKFQRALKRLKSKSERDPLRRMLEKHVNTLLGLAEATKADQQLFKDALTIIDDYSFEGEPQQPSNTFNPYQSVFGR